MTSPSPMKSPDRDAADELATAITRLREIACQGDNISYPSGAAARRVRSAIRDFLALAYAPPAVGRNTTAAALRVAAMGQGDVELNALRDPDIFRDVARAYLIDASELATLRRRERELFDALTKICERPNGSPLTDIGQIARVALSPPTQKE